MAESTLEYRPPRTGVLLLLAFLVAFDLGCAWLAFGGPPKDPSRGMGLFALLASVLSTLALLPLAIRPRAALRVGTEGFETTGRYGAVRLRMPWTNVARVEVVPGPYHPVLRVVPRDQARALAEGPPAMRRPLPPNATLLHDPFVIEPRVYGQDAGPLREHMMRHVGPAQPGDPA